MTEHEKAKQWRKNQGLTLDQLAEHIGYSREAIYWFERGCTPPRRYKNKLKKGRQIDPYVWLRYKMACAGFDSYGNRQFDWE